MKKNKCYFLFFTLLAYHNVFANSAAEISSCYDVDVRTKLSEEKKQFFSSSRNQGDTNWCYAYTTADLLSFETEQPVSAMQIAVNYNSRLSSFDRLWRKIESWISNYELAIWDGGFVSVALKAIMKQDYPGVCSEKALPSSIGTENFKKTMADLKNFIVTKKLLDENLLQEISRIFVKLPVDQLKASLEEAQKNNMSIDELMKRLVHSACQGHYFNLKKKKVKNYNRWFANLQEVLSRNLNQMRPMGLIYDSTYSHKVLPEEKTILTGMVPDHATIAIGRRWNNEAHHCEILIRDSFGNKCDKLDLNKVICNQDGTFWIREKDLIDALFFTSSLNDY